MPMTIARPLQKPIITGSGSIEMNELKTVMSIMGFDGDSAEMMQINKETMCILFPTLTAVECLQGII